MTTTPGSPDIRSILGRVTVFGATPPDFDPDIAPADPLELFAEWLADAVDAGVADPNAMTLSTVDADGSPDARVLILRDATPQGWSFGTSSSSPKGRQLAAARAAALTFYWPARGRQVRVRGRVIEGSAAENAESFLSRGTGGRAESFLGRQSDVIDDPDEPRDRRRTPTWSRPRGRSTRSCPRRSNSGRRRATARICGCATAPRATRATQPASTHSIPSGSGPEAGASDLNPRPCNDRGGHRRFRR
jgi:pyridoxamine 5'-phosphate oxidase